MKLMVACWRCPTSNRPWLRWMSWSASFFCLVPGRLRSDEPGRDRSSRVLSRCICFFRGTCTNCSDRWWTLGRRTVWGDVWEVSCRTWFHRAHSLSALLTLPNAQQHHTTSTDFLRRRQPQQPHLYSPRFLQIQRPPLRLLQIHRLPRRDLRKPSPRSRSN